jgi:hypothetical protein
MKTLLRILRWIFGGFISIIAAIAFYEALVFAQSNEASALLMARGEFLNVCERNGLNPTEFSGPRRIQRRDRAYEFVWKNPSNGDEIGALASYLPVGAEAWLLRGEEMRGIKERFKLN